MAYPLISVSDSEFVMRYIPPPPPPVDISITFNKKFQWNPLEKDVILNALNDLIYTPKFMARFPNDINSLQIQIITTLHKDKVQDRCDHINCRFYWKKANGENNRDKETDVSHLYFNDFHNKIWQISETKYTNDLF
jgi:hypothetical protein